MKKIEIAFFWSHSLGDFVVSTPLLRRIKNTYPESHITYITIKTQHRNLFLNSPYIDKLFEISKSNIKNLIIDLIKLRTQRFDLVFSPFPHKKFSRALVGLIKGQRLVKSRHNLYDKKNIINKGFDVLEAFGISIKGSDKKLLWPFDIREYNEKINYILHKNHINYDDLLIGIHLGAKKDYYNRIWPTRNWVNIINYLIRDLSAKIVFVGSGWDKVQTVEVIKHIEIKKGIVNLVDRLNIKETAVLINRCKMFISTNSGPMWIAAAFQKPQIALCGPSLFQWEPYNDNALVIRNVINRKGCNPPCDVKKCQYRDNLCIESIEVDIVKKAVDKIMNKI